jgi:prevent-host-death family protein
MKHMKTVGIRALKQNASAVVAEAVAGEEITITDRGRPVAMLTPMPTAPLDRLIASGQARPALKDIRDLPPAQPGDLISPALLAARDDERY